MKSVLGGVGAAQAGRSCCGGLSPGSRAEVKWGTKGEGLVYQAGVKWK